MTSVFLCGARWEPFIPPSAADPVKWQFAQSFLQIFVYFAILYFPVARGIIYSELRKSTRKVRYTMNTTTNINATLMNDLLFVEVTEERLFGYGVGTVLTDEEIAELGDLE